MAASIPVSVPVFTTLRDDIDYVLAEHQNTPNDEITALATLVGMLGIAQGHSTSFLTALQNFRFGCNPVWNSTTTIDVSLGQIVVSNAAGTIRKLRSKTTASSLTAASDMDTGSSFAASTAYYIYATADTGVTTPVYKISASASAPTGFTYYRKVGGFRTDGSSNILQNSIYSVVEGPDTRVPKGYIYGGRISNNASDATNDLDITACVARDDSDMYTITLGTTFTKRVDTTFTAGDGGGGLDTGTIGASGAKVYVFLIGKSTDAGAGDVLFSKSSSPTMPSGWDIKRLLGIVYWASTAWTKFQMHGQGPDVWFEMDGIQILSSGSQTSFTDIDVSSYVDPTYTRAIHCTAHVSQGTVSEVALRARLNGSSESAGVANEFHADHDDQSGPGNPSGGSRGNVFLDSSGIFEYAVTGGSANMYVRGYGVMR